MLPLVVSVNHGVSVPLFSISVSGSASFVQLVRSLNRAVFFALAFAALPLAATRGYERSSSPRFAPLPRHF